MKLLLLTTLALSLGEAHYRRSEESWTEAGQPTAEIVISASRDAVIITVVAETGPSLILPDDAGNEMDNEHPDVNATGLQLSVRDTSGTVHRWLVRPGTDGVARVRALTRDPLAADVATNVDADGWTARIAIALRTLGDASPYSIALGVTINEIPPGRERRRGQLVLGGAAGEWVYLRGDRDDPSQLLPIVIDR